MASFYILPRNILRCDIDGTIANISTRLKMAEQQFPTKCYKYFNVLLDGKNYHMDRPVIAAREFLKDWVKGNQRIVVYLSGRRAGTETQTKEWLQKYEFPDGEIIHRAKGIISGKFKADELIKLQRRYKVAAHIGDRDDDEWASKRANVRFVRVKLDEWVTRHDVREQKLENLITIVRTDDGNDDGFAAFHSDKESGVKATDNHDANDNEKGTASSSKVSTSDKDDVSVGCDMPAPPPPPRAQDKAHDDREDMPAPPPGRVSRDKTSGVTHTDSAPQRKKTPATSTASTDEVSSGSSEGRTRHRGRSGTPPKSDNPFAWQ
eukprot:GEMP01064836.1.p1 GENE.GEMP01064836.1~~GEMP01064836.1.p1  ORF type:complete len:320 (+),score=83.03 GEMP01064836.1:84-1043(+)